MIGQINAEKTHRRTSVFRITDSDIVHSSADKEPTDGEVTDVEPHIDTGGALKKDLVDSESSRFLDVKGPESRFNTITLDLFELAVFRTQVCEFKLRGLPCKLDVECTYSHCVSWHRRNPFLVAYKPTICPRLVVNKLNGKLTIRNSCRYGRACPYSHTKEEQMYHPTIYKSRKCKQMEICSKFFCPFSHRQEVYSAGDPVLWEAYLNAARQYSSSNVFDTTAKHVLDGLQDRALDLLKQAGYNSVSN